MDVSSMELEIQPSFVKTSEFGGGLNPQTTPIGVSLHRVASVMVTDLRDMHC
jgi:hypothetical protein